MHIGMITDSLPDTGFDAMLDVAARLRMDALEFGCGNWSAAPHLALDRLLESAEARREFRARLADHGIGISALNCSGNPLHPGEDGRRHDEVTRKTIRLARLLDVDRVVMMSGCPGAPGDRYPNWITTEWPPEVREIARWQWDEVLLPYWRGLVAFAREQGVAKLCLELHGHQNVYSVATLGFATPSATRSVPISILDVDGRRPDRRCRCARRRDLLRACETRGSIRALPA
jgi:sugar phosphate isomerase/epimerase